MHGWELLNEHGRRGVRSWYRRLRLIGIDKHQARQIIIGTMHGVTMAPYWVDRKPA